MRVNPIRETSIDAHYRPLTATDAGFPNLRDSINVHGRPPFSTILVVDWLYEFNRPRRLFQGVVVFVVYVDSRKLGRWGPLLIPRRDDAIRCDLQAMRCRTSASGKPF